MVAQQKPSPEDGRKGLTVFPRSDTHMIHSTTVGQTFKVDVLLPPHEPDKKLRFPVVYATDGNAVIDMFKGIATYTQAFDRTAPPFILVTIGYPGDSPAAGEVLRGRDLTFQGCPDPIGGLSIGEEWEGVLQPEAGTTSFGGGELFKRFLSEELIPFINERYPTVPEERVYFGHSLGGSFGLFTLFTQPALFNKYVISSPAVTYHGQAPNGTRYENHDFMIRRAQDFTLAGYSLNRVRLHMSVGSEEQFEPHIANWRLTSGFYLMLASLKNAALPGLELTEEVFSGATHAAACPLAFVRGIRAVFTR